MLSKEDKIANKKERLEKALYNWLNETEKVEEDTGCYVGIDKNNKQRLVGGILSERM